MKKTIVSLLVVAAFLQLFTVTASASEPEDFIQKMLPLALYYQETEGILVSLNIGQSFLETGAGEHLCGGNNYYGMTYTKDGVAYFKKYDSMEESMADYIRNFKRPLYDEVLLADNYKDAVAAVKACGYASDPNYVAKVVAIIEEYELYKYDQYKPVIFTSARGDRGQRVVKMQEMLLELGYDLQHYGADGVYGPVTQAAVRQFQLDHGLMATGDADQDTMGMLAYYVNLEKESGVNACD